MPNETGPNWDNPEKDLKIITVGELPIEDRRTLTELAMRAASKASALKNITPSKHSQGYYDIEVGFFADLGRAIANTDAKPLTPEQERGALLILQGGIDQLETLYYEISGVSPGDPLANLMRIRGLLIPGLARKSYR